MGLLSHFYHIQITGTSKGLWVTHFKETALREGRSSAMALIMVLLSSLLNYRTFDIRLAVYCMRTYITYCSCHPV